MKPRIFISAVTKELRSARQIVANTLMALGYEPIWQDIFGMSGEDIRPMLRKKIDSCSAVLQIVGETYGAEPPAADAEFGRVSYTQYEALYARATGKKVYYLIAQHDMPSDAPPESVDAPREDSDAARADANQRRQLQQEYRASIQSTEHIFYAVQSHPETELAVRRLKDELDKLRRGFRNWMIGVTAGLILIVGGVAWVNRDQWKLAKSVEEGQKKTAEQIVVTGEKTKEAMKEVLESAVKELTNPGALAERIRKEIHATAEVKIKALPDVQGRGRKISEIEKERDLAAGRVDDLVKLIQEGLKEGASPVFQRAADILQKEGTDEALAYLESRRESTLVTARRHAEQAKSAQARAESEKELRNKSLQALVLEAELLESKLQWEPALKIREQTAELAPDWFEARNRLAKLYFHVANYPKAEAHSRETLKLATNANEEAIASNNLAMLLQETNRLAEAEPLYRRALVLAERTSDQLFSFYLRQFANVLADRNRLGEASGLMQRSLAMDEESIGSDNTIVSRQLVSLGIILQQTNQLPEAELLMRRGLAIDERFEIADHPNIALSLGALASLLRNTSRVAEAEPLMRRALAIFEQSYGTEHPEVATNLNNLAELIGANRLAEAEPLLRRALAIGEQSYGAEHPSVAVKLYNLAALLKATNRMAEAEPLMRRALAILEQSYGAEHSDVAIGLNNLAQLLQATNRLAEAEPLMRRALAIDEKVYRAEHPDIAKDLNNLAMLLIATKRLTEAEPLMHRQVVIYHRFGIDSGHSHPRTQNALENYRILLEKNQYSPNEIDQKLKETTETTAPLEPINPEVERLLGPAQSVADVLLGLDRQYKTEGKQPVYFLAADQPIAPHLNELLKPNADSLLISGVSAFRSGLNADAIVLYEEAIGLREDKPGSPQLNFTTRMNRAAALRELGEVEQARDELRSLLPELDKDAATPTLTKGRARYHLALCEWRSGDSTVAKRLADESLHEYGEDPALSPLKVQTEQLLSDLKDSKPPPPLATLDPEVELDSARARYRARVALASLPLKESTMPLLEQMLGPAKSTKEVLDTLDKQYREAGKPAIWFLPLSEPISPHLVELLGELPPLTTFDQK